MRTYTVEIRRAPSDKWIGVSSYTDFKSAKVEAHIEKLKGFHTRVVARDNNPMTKRVRAPVHPEALAALKKYKGDVKAGHLDAAEYWRGQAGAYFTANPKGGNMKGHKPGCNCVVCNPRSRYNPGARVHSQAASYFRKQTIDKKLVPAARMSAEARVPIEEQWARESRRMGMPNPSRRRKTKGAPLLLIGAVGVGLAMLLSRNK